MPVAEIAGFYWTGNRKFGNRFWIQRADLAKDVPADVGLETFQFNVGDAALRRLFFRRHMFPRVSESTCQSGSGGSLRGVLSDHPRSNFCLGSSGIQYG